MKSRKCFYLLIATLIIQNSHSENIFFEDENLDFLIEIYRVKEISSLTAFLCTNNQKENRMITKKFSENFLQLLIVNLPNQDSFVDRKQYRHEGIIVDPKCDGIEDLLLEAKDHYKFTDLNHWVFLEISSDNSTESDQISSLGNDLLTLTEICVDSQVIWVQKNVENIFTFFDPYKISISFPLNVSIIGSYPEQNISEILHSVDPPGRRRKNLQQNVMQGGVAIVFPDQFTSMDDLRKRHIDTYSKWNFPLSKTLIEDLNITINVTTVNSFGWEINGTGVFDGLMGMFQRNECDLALVGALMRLDRMKVVDFTTDAIQVKAQIIFRNPPLSSLSNIFILPFDYAVWGCSFGLFLFIGFLFVLQIWVDRKNRVNTNMMYFDVFTFITGAICQQGTSLEPVTVSSRTTVLLVFIASVFFYTSYSANIVTLLQTPSSSIRTVDDLVESPLEVGVQNIPYFKILLQESKHLSTQNLYNKKILTRPDKGFIEPAEGMKMVQEGMFAFQVDMAVAYDYVSSKYTETEKCGLSEIDLIHLPMQTIPVRKKLPYRDLFIQRLRWQKEIGIWDRTKRRWVPQKPQCETAKSGYSSVGLTEMLPAVHIILYGTIISILIFVFELVTNLILKKINYKKKKKSLELIRNTFK